MWQILPGSIVTEYEDWAWIDERLIWGCMGVEFWQWLIAFVKVLDIRQAKTVRSRHRYCVNCKCVYTLSAPRSHREVKGRTGRDSKRAIGHAIPWRFSSCYEKEIVFCWTIYEVKFRWLEDSVDMERSTIKRDDNFSRFWILYMNPTLGLEWISYAIDVQIMKRHWGW